MALAARGIKAHLKAVRVLVRAEGLSFKKPPLAEEQTRPDVARRRTPWKADQTKIAPQPRCSSTRPGSNPTWRLARPGVARKTPAGLSAPRPLENDDLHRRPALRPHRRRWVLDGPINAGRNFIDLLRLAPERGSSGRSGRGEAATRPTHPVLRGFQSLLLVLSKSAQLFARLDRRARAAEITLRETQ